MLPNFLSLFSKDSAQSRDRVISLARVCVCRHFRLGEDPFAFPHSLSLSLSTNVYFGFLSRFRFFCFKMNTLTGGIFDSFIARSTNSYDHFCALVVTWAYTFPSMIVVWH